MEKILFLVPYPRGNAPSQRYRFEQYFKILEDNDFQIEFAPFLDLKTWKVLYKTGHQFQKLKGYALGVLRRLRLLFRIKDYDWIFIHREAIILGPSWYEWVLVRFLGRRIIYDFDDAIWLEATSASNRLVSILKNPSKTAHICKLCERVSAGNEYLSEYALKYNKQVTVIPTTIDTWSRHNVLKQHLPKKVVIGWTGSHSTLGYLSPIIPVLSEMERNHDFEFKVIADQDPNFDLSTFRFSRWDISTEIKDLLEIDIGLMPLSDNNWTRGKCGFKALQYLSLGIPAVVSPVGVNREIVSHGVEGFRCIEHNEWLRFISELIGDYRLRNEMGRKGREKIINNYSVEALTPKFLSLFA